MTSSGENNDFNSKKVGELWDENADLWIELASSGYDVYRDYVNTPGFFEILPSITGQRGLDIGCGYGHNTRLLQQAGAKMTGIDISNKFIKHAVAVEDTEKLGILYKTADATKLPFRDNEFDFITAFVSLMDIPEYLSALAEAFRVLKKGGFFQFSITHPCFWTPKLEWVFDEKGKRKGLVCKNYFSSSSGTVNEWMFDCDKKKEIGNKKFKTPIFRRTLSEWFNALTNSNFAIELVHEPRPLEKDIKNFPVLEQCSIVPFFLIVRCRKK